MAKEFVISTMGAWTRTTIPKGGSLKLYDTGLLNILDESGRATGVIHNVQGIVQLFGKTPKSDVEDEPLVDQAVRVNDVIRENWGYNAPTGYSKSTVDGTYTVTK